MFQTIGKVVYKNRKVPVEVVKTINSEPLNSPYFRIYFVCNGQGIVIKDQEKIPYVGPCMLCANEIEEVQFASEKEHEVYVLGFHPSFIHDEFTYELLRENIGAPGSAYNREKLWLSPFLKRQHLNGFIDLSKELEVRVKTLFSQVNSELYEQRDGYWPCRTRSYFIELLILLERMTSNQDMLVDFGIFESDITEDIAEYLNKNYMYKVSLSELTEKFSLNRTTLTNKFKEKYNQTPLQYLKELRLNTAKALLENTALQIVEISRRVGFEDKAHFHRTFKAHTKFSPKDYRIKVLNDQ